jgi:thioredoxin reductase
MRHPQFSKTQKQMDKTSFDVIIIGAGPAGLSGALVLGRCRRRVLVCDAGHPRNAASHGLHNYLTRDGADPAEFLRVGRAELQSYDTVKLLTMEVRNARRLGSGFEVTLSNGECAITRKLLIATGVVDDLPKLEGLESFYGRSVFHCPYCDGWEMRDQPLAIYGQGENGLGLALELILWSSDLVLCTDGPSGLSVEDLERLTRHQIALREERILRLEGRDGVLDQIVFADGTTIKRRGMFFSTGQRQGSNLPEKLGCEFTEQGCVATDEYEATNVAGLYVAGDASRLVQFVIVAASEGAQAAVAINKELMKEDLMDC